MGVLSTQVKFTDFPLCRAITNDVLLKIAKERYPDKKSYKQTTLAGNFVCIDKNKLFKVLMSVKHDEKANTTTFMVEGNMTALGHALDSVFPFLDSDFYKEVHEVMSGELGKYAKTDGAVSLLSGGDSVAAAEEPKTKTWRIVLAVILALAVTLMELWNDWDFWSDLLGF